MMHLLKLRQRIWLLTFCILGERLVSCENLNRHYVPINQRGTGVVDRSLESELKTKSLFKLREKMIRVLVTIASQETVFYDFKTMSFFMLVLYGVVK